MEMHFDWTFFWQSLFHPSGAFLAGLGMTVAISVVSMVLGLVLGLIVALMRLSRNRALRIIASVYVWILQGIPLLVVLVVIYLGLAAANIYKFQDTSVMGVVLAGSVKAGFSSMRWIILPQAVRTMIPPLGNQFNTLMKNTSLLSIIGVSEMFLVTQSISSATFKTFEIFLVTGVYYLLLTTVWTILQNEIECHLSRQLGIPVKSMLSKAASAIRAVAAGNTKTKQSVAPEAHA